MSRSKLGPRGEAPYGASQSTCHSRPAGLFTVYASERQEEGHAAGRRSSGPHRAGHRRSQRRSRRRRPEQPIASPAPTWSKPWITGAGLALCRRDLQPTSSSWSVRALARSSNPRSAAHQRTGLLQSMWARPALRIKLPPARVAAGEARDPRRPLQRRNPTGQSSTSDRTRTTQDTFVVYRGNKDDPNWSPLDAPAVWRYSGKNVLDSPSVPAVEAFRKAIAESEKQLASNP